MSTQVEALFIINLLFFCKKQNPLFYSPNPIIGHKLLKKTESEKGFIIKMAYLKYNIWYRKIKIIGIENAIRYKIYPFNNSFLYWSMSAY